MDDLTTPTALRSNLQASWARSHSHGLQPDQALPVIVLTGADLDDRLQANARLLTFSRPVIENLYRQIDSPASTVLLTDSQGLILSALGDSRLLDRAAQVALRPGAHWSEAIMGTNAIGTALATGGIVTVQGSEHYLERNRALTCVATPIFAPTGGIAGILDVSTDARADLSHAQALLRTTAECIEHRLIESMDEGFLTIRFHPRADLIGGPLEGLALFDEGGRLLACNRAARVLLQLLGERPRAYCDDCFATQWRSLVGWAALNQPTLFPLRTRHGQTCAARASLRLPHTGQPTASPQMRPSLARTRARPEGHLSTFNLGDQRVAEALLTLEQWGWEDGPLLIEGETGTGKRHLVHAYHHHHAAGTALVSVDCATLAAIPALRPKIDNALRQAKGGILYLTDFDALPPDEQGRLFTAASATTRVIASTRSGIDPLHREQHVAMAAFAKCGGRAIQLPPLRARTDFDGLARQFVRAACPDRPLYVCPDALALLRSYRWPGNLSELNNRLRLILALIGDDAGQLCPEDIPEELLDHGGN